MGIGLGSNIFSCANNDREVSPPCVTSQAARTRQSVYSVALHQQPESEHFTPSLGFLVGVANSMTLGGLHLWSGKEAAQPCPTSRWMKW